MKFQRPLARYALVLWASLAASRLAAAQQLRGTVFFADSATPALGVVVQASDSTGAVVARTVTSLSGTFALPLALPGRYGLRVLRIGYRPHEVRPQLLTAATPPLVIVLRTAQVALPAVTVRGERECRDRPDSVAVVFAAWEEARKALQSAELAAGSGGHVAEWFSYRRTTGDSGVITSEEVAAATKRTTRPFLSLPPDSLQRLGYKRIDGKGDLYYGPDATVLLSNAFLGGHCFRLSPSTHTGWIGVEFDPVRERRDVVDIAGTAWIDRATSELRLVEFHYTNVPREMREAGADGRIELARLPSGLFVISRWHIRLSGIEETFRRVTDFGLRRVERRRLANSLSLSGGELQHARVGERELYATPAVVTTVQVLGEAGAPAPAKVLLRARGDAGISALTDADGVARFVGLPPGEHVVEVTTPASRAISMRPLMRTIRTGGATLAATITASDADVAAMVCPANVDTRATTLLRGTAMQTDGWRLGLDTIVVRWAVVPTNAVPDLADSTQWVVARVRTDADGRFTVCGIPRTAIVAVWPVPHDDEQPDVGWVEFNNEPAIKVVTLTVKSRK
ncbi:MAG: carboxypeptidase regulatory-like domain-containing protein [Gemmatimonadetes bacterium]|nr:carboxypeptidase regulatory-like domain-containing protein [Gemmatimonadota bacterium]